MRVEASHFLYLLETFDEIFSPEQGILSGAARFFLAARKERALCRGGVPWGVVAGN
jgi:hypothetical protein